MQWSPYHILLKVLISRIIWVGFVNIILRQFQVHLFTREKKKNTCKPTTYWEKWYSIYKQQNLRVWVTCCTAVPFSFPYITTLKFQVVYKGNRIFIHQQQTSQQFRNPFLTDDWDKHVVSGRNFEIDTKLIFGIISRNRKIFLWGVRGLRGKKKQKHEEIHNLIQALLLSYFPLFKL